MGRVTKAIIAFVLLGIAIYFGIQAYHSWLRTTEAQNTADKALAEYIRAVEETYGTDQSKWPQCVQETDLCMIH